MLNKTMFPTTKDLSTHVQTIQTTLQFNLLLPYLSVPKRKENTFTDTKDMKLLQQMLKC